MSETPVKSETPAISEKSPLISDTPVSLWSRTAVPEMSLGKYLRRLHILSKEKADFSDSESEWCIVPSACTVLVGNPRSHPAFEQLFLSCRSSFRYTTEGFWSLWPYFSLAG